MSVLIWIQTVSHFDTVPDRNLEKVNFEKNSRRQQKHEQLPSMQSVIRLLVLPVKKTSWQQLEN